MGSPREFEDLSNLKDRVVALIAEARSDDAVKLLPQLLLDARAAHIEDDQASLLAYLAQIAGMHAKLGLADRARELFDEAIAGVGRLKPTSPDNPIAIFQTSMDDRKWAVLTEIAQAMASCGQPAQAINVIGRISDAWAPKFSVLIDVIQSLAQQRDHDRLRALASTTHRYRDQILAIATDWQAGRRLTATRQGWLQMKFG